MIKFVSCKKFVRIMFKLSHFFETRSEYQVKLEWKPFKFLVSIFIRTWHFKTYKCLIATVWSHILCFIVSGFTRKDTANLIDFDSFSVEILSHSHFSWFPAKMCKTITRTNKSVKFLFYLLGKWYFILIDITILSDIYFKLM